MQQTICCESKVKNVTFYYRKSNPTTIVGLKDVEAISSLAIVQEYFWVDRDLERGQKIRHDLASKVKTTAVQSVEDCKLLLQEMIALLESRLPSCRKNMPKVGIICPDPQLLPKLHKLCSSLSNVDKIYFLSLDFLDEKQEQLTLMIKSGKFGSKFMAIYEWELETNVGQKLLPNFSFLGTDNLRSVLQKSNLQIIVQQQFDHHIMVRNMQKIARAVAAESEFQKVQNFIRSFNSPMDISRTIRFYADESFLYKLINNLIRKSENPTQLFYIQPYVKNLFTAIYKLYSIQKGNRKYDRLRKFECYRGAKFSAKELDQFKNNVGECVQCLGFLSTSLSDVIATGFEPNTFITVEVNNSERDWEIDYGYADISKISNKPWERQVLFNMLNSFLIKSFHYDETNKLNLITLEYGIAAHISSKSKKPNCVLTEQERRLSSVVNRIPESIQSNYCQGKLIYLYNVYLESEFELSREYFRLERQMYETQPSSRKPGWHRIYFVNFCFRAMISLNESKFQELDQVLRQLEERMISMSEVLQDSVKFFLRVEICRIKAEALTSTQRNEEGLELTDASLKMLAEQGPRFQQFAKHVKMQSLVLSLFRFQCLVGLGRIKDAHSFLLSITAEMERCKNQLPGLYDSGKTIETNSNFLQGNSQQQKIKKAKYMVNQLFSKGKTSRNVMSSVMNYSINFLLEYSQCPQEKKNDERFHLLHIGNLIKQVEDLIANKQTQTENFQQKLSQLMHFLRIVPQKMRAFESYPLALFKTSGILLQIRRYKQSLQFAELCAGIKSASSIQYMQNEARLCKFKIACGQFEAACGIMEELEAYHVIEEIKTCLGQIQCLLRLKQILDGDQQEQELAQLKSENLYTTQKIDEGVYFLMDVANSMGQQRNSEDSIQMEESRHEQEQVEQEEKQDEEQEQEQNEQQEQEQRQGEQQVQFQEEQQVEQVRVEQVEQEEQQVEQEQVQVQVQEEQEQQQQEQKQQVQEQQVEEHEQQNEEQQEECLRSAKQLIQNGYYQEAINSLRRVAEAELDTASDEKRVCRKGSAKLLQAVALQRLNKLQQAKKKYLESRTLFTNYALSNLQVLGAIQEALDEIEATMTGNTQAEPQMRDEARAQIEDQISAEPQIRAEDISPARNPSEGRVVVEGDKCQCQIF